MIEKINSEKKLFLVNEFVTSSITAGLSTRNKKSPIYNHDSSEVEKAEFRGFLRVFLLKIWEDHRLQKNINELQLLAYFEKMQNESATKFTDLLFGGKLRYGICQKIINVFLKFLWVSDEIETPPHAPYDGIIQAKLKDKNLSPWTEINDPAQYTLFVNLANEISKGNIAKWELEEWNKK
jgi:hypothetical protein